jgi:predicted ATPase
VRIYTEATAIKVATSCGKGIEDLMTDRTRVVHLAHDRESALESNTGSASVMIQLQLMSGSEDSLIIE